MQASLFITQHKQSGLFKLFWKLTIFQQWFELILIANGHPWLIINH
jgi:hypothetical protein